MRKILLTAIIVLALVLIYASTELMACGMKGKSQVSKLIGAALKNPEGEEVGVITDVVTDPGSKAAFAIIAYGPEDLYGLRRRMIALPVAILSCGGMDCVVNVEKERLDTAPYITSKDDFMKRRMAEGVYRYFGLQPYWTEESHGMTWDSLRGYESF